MHPTIWDQDNIAMLMERWNNGRTASEIAAEFKALGYNVSRNAVIGKVHRLKLSPQLRKKVETYPQLVRIVTRLPESKPKASTNGSKGREVVKVPTGSKAILLSESGENNCRAIIGYQGNGIFIQETTGKSSILANALCCGEDRTWTTSSFGVKRRSSWCAYHHKRFTVMGKL